MGDVLQMSRRTPRILIGGWNCTCTLEDSPERSVNVIVELTPCLGSMSEIAASYRSTVEVKLELGDGGLQKAASMSGMRACRGAGRNVLAFLRFDDVRIAEIRALVVSYAGETKRIKVAEGG